jgi:hypothetical protein
VTPQVFQFIGPSNDGRRHGRGTYLFSVKKPCQKTDKIVVPRPATSFSHPVKMDFLKISPDPF